MNFLNNLIVFLERLEDKNIFYKLTKVRDGIMVEIVIPGQRWEVEHMADGTIVIEKFISDGIIFGENEIDVLFRDFSD